jgi:hypothetical protein
VSASRTKGPVSRVAGDARPDDLTPDLEIKSGKGGADDDVVTVTDDD